MPTVLPIRSGPLEDAVGAAADVLGRDAGQLLVAHRQREGELAVRPLLRPHAEVDQVVPVEGGEEERRRHAELGEELVRLALGVEVRDLVLAHAASACACRVSGTPHARVLERRPDHVLDAGGLRGLGHGARLGQLLLRREVVPEERDAEGAVRALESAPQARRVVDVGGDDLGAQPARAPWPCRSSTSRVSARAANPPFGSARIARTSPPPCAPVAPTTAIVFLAMDSPSLRS